MIQSVVALASAMLIEPDGQAGARQIASQPPSCTKNYSALVTGTEYRNLYHHRRQLECTGCCVVVCCNVLQCTVVRCSALQCCRLHYVVQAAALRALTCVFLDMCLR
mmetsp:Transcript_36026/g.58068  ORF Transcript_36026/g.58068 Transcript_36026/m.58068 type:complete len:107 (+) Transcript_36026:36-356(+)